jgi:hypothetical protein
VNKELGLIASEKNEVDLTTIDHKAEKINLIIGALTEIFDELIGPSITVPDLNKNKENYTQKERSELDLMGKDLQKRINNQSHEIRSEILRLRREQEQREERNEEPSDNDEAGEDDDE